MGTVAAMPREIYLIVISVYLLMLLYRISQIIERIAKVFIKIIPRRSAEIRFPAVLQNENGLLVNNQQPI
jgi:hypothetical protein